MTGTLIDTSVLSDVLDASSPWHEWSADALLLASARGPIVLTTIVYAEASIPFEDPVAFELAIGDDFERRPMPSPAGFLAGKAFLEYRRRGGTKASPLPDFFIGAHAAVEGLDILTRDPRRFLSYFRGITVISPPESD